jgi:RNA polymerase sigma factor (sigma-70 family)
MVGLARRHLGGRPRGAADEEDVALSAFDSFVKAAGAGRFPRLDDRSDLWQVLFLITARKAADLREAEGRQKRGGGRVVQSLAAGDGSTIVPVVSADPDPAEAALLGEQMQTLLAALTDPTLRQIALWKLEGYTNQEIAQRLGRSEPTVERKLRRIRETWEGLEG